jgi:hypothetical protein
MSTAPSAGNEGANAQIILKVAKAIGALLDLSLAALLETLKPILRSLRCASAGSMATRLVRQLRNLLQATENIYSVLELSMNLFARRLDSSHSHRGFSPVIEQIADGASRLFFGLLSNWAGESV